MLRWIRGMHEDPPPFDQARMIERVRFVDAMRETTPQVFDALAVSVFPLFAVACREMPALAHGNGTFGDYLFERHRPGAPIPRARRALRDALIDWAIAFNLRTRWTCEYALDALIFWLKREASSTLDDRLLGYGGPRGPDGEVGSPWLAGGTLFGPWKFDDAEPPELSAWDPKLSDWAAYRTLAIAELDDYGRRIQELRRPASAAHRDDKRALEHFAWLARVQCGGEKIQDIAAELAGARTEFDKGGNSTLEKERKRVSKAVNEKRARLDLPSPATRSQGR